MKSTEFPPLPEGFEYRLDLRHHVTPRLLKVQPIHRWFAFPHSYSPQLIDEILKTYYISSNGKILDPFVGAGTTVLRARELGYSAVGTDLSPLSLFVSRVKLNGYDKTSLEEALDFILIYHPLRNRPTLPARIQKAFTDLELRHLFGLRARIEQLPQPTADFFQLALLRVEQLISRATPDGGWFRWVEKEDQSRLVKELFERQAKMQMEDIAPFKTCQSKILSSDARFLDNVTDKFEMAITSPPYPNRHDYSRIFHIELLALGLEEEDIASFRHHSIRSHVEAERPCITPSDYRMPEKLAAVLGQLPANADPRIAPMLQGYFEDMHMTLKAISARLLSGGWCAFVVGNVRHAGVMIPVDEILAEIGENLGYMLQAVWVARLRGNSAQQMGRFGREPARESIVVFRKR